MRLFVCSEISGGHSTQLKQCKESASIQRRGDLELMKRT
jgi:hypothetical protein